MDMKATRFINNFEHILRYHGLKDYTTLDFSTQTISTQTTRSGKRTSGIRTCQGPGVVTEVRASKVRGISKLSSNHDAFSSNLSLRSATSDLYLHQQ